jgi:hypothetical protein
LPAGFPPVRLVTFKIVFAPAFSLNLCRQLRAATTSTSILHAPPPTVVTAVHTVVPSTVTSSVDDMATSVFRDTSLPDDADLDALLSDEASAPTNRVTVVAAQPHNQPTVPLPPSPSASASASASPSRSLSSSRPTVVSPRAMARTTSVPLSSPVRALAPRVTSPVASQHAPTPTRLSKSPNSANHKSATSPPPTAPARTGAFAPVFDSVAVIGAMLKSQRSAGSAAQTRISALESELAQLRRTQEVERAKSSQEAIQLTNQRAIVETLRSQLLRKDKMLDTANAQVCVCVCVCVCDIRSASSMERAAISLLAVIQF